MVLYVTTALSHFTGFPNNSAYSSSKAGAVRVFSTLQAEHPELRVICLHPGVVNVGGKVSGAKQAGLADDGEFLTNPSTRDFERQSLPPKVRNFDNQT